MFIAGTEKDLVAAVYDQSGVQVSAGTIYTVVRLESNDGYDGYYWHSDGYWFEDPTLPPTAEHFETGQWLYTLPADATNNRGNQFIHYTFTDSLTEASATTVSSGGEHYILEAAPLTTASITSAVWDAARASYTTAGTFGETTNLTSDGLATSAAQEIRDEILSDSTPFAGANIDAAISSRSSHTANNVRDAILSDSTPFAGANIDATISSRSSHTANNVRDAILSDSTPFPGSYVNVPVSSRSSHNAGDVWAVSADGYTATGTFGQIVGKMVAAETTALAGSTTTEVRTGLTQADGFYDDMVILIVNSAGIAARNVTSYSNTNGAFTVITLPFTPDAGDVVIVMSAVSAGSVTAVVDTAAIADAVWDEAVADHDTAGSTGEKINDVATTSDVQVNVYESEPS